jgi:hypothetical protein
VAALLSACLGAVVAAQATGPWDRFDQQLRCYLTSRERLDRAIPRSACAASVDRATCHLSLLAEQIRHQRRHAGRGAIIGGDTAGEIRARVASALGDLDEPASHLLRIYRQGRVPNSHDLRVNDDFAWLQEVELPPSVASALPRLPPPLAFHLVGTGLLLVDDATGVILDIVDDVLPSAT